MLLVKRVALFMGQKKRGIDLELALSSESARL